MTNRDPLLNLPIDAVPRRTAYELLLVVAPGYPNWLRRNHTEVAMGQENDEAVYSLYTTWKTEDGTRQLWRIATGPVGHAEDATYEALLMVWREDLEQTRMNTPWQVAERNTSALPLSRDAAIRGFMATLPETARKTVLTSPTTDTSRDDIRRTRGV